MLCIWLQTPTLDWLRRDEADNVIRSLTNLVTPVVLARNMHSLILINNGDDTVSPCHHHSLGHGARFAVTQPLGPIMGSLKSRCNLSWFVHEPSSVETVAPNWWLMNKWMNELKDTTVALSPHFVAGA